MADGHVVAVPHGRQQDAAGDGETQKEEELSPAALQGDGPAQPVRLQSTRRVTTMSRKSPRWRAHLERSTWGGEGDGRWGQSS